MRQTTNALLASLMLLASHANAAGDPLAKVRTIHLSYQSNADMPNCPTSLAQALAKQGFGLVSMPVQADAILRVNLDVFPGKLRSNIRWGAVLEDHANTRLYSAYGEESSWTAQAACHDLADDLAEDLMDDIRKARILSR